MHLDLSTSNIMWDAEADSLRIIDYAGTIGDDSFLDIGSTVTRVCTRSTRAPEYSSEEILWQRNESSEALSVYYALMSHIFSREVINDQPYAKESSCRERVRVDIELWNTEWRSRVEDSAELPGEIMCIRRVHDAARSLPKDRPPLEWILSSGTDASDREALEMGCIGSIPRFTYIRQCVTRYISQWPQGDAELDDEWRALRARFVALLIGRIDCPGTVGVTCGGLASKTIPPPYTTVRCLALYDGLTTIVREGHAEDSLIHYMSNIAYYNLLVNGILYVALSTSKTQLVDVEHYSGHPLHVVLRAIVKFPNLLSVFLSPITVFALLTLETPRATVNDQAASAVRLSEATPKPKPETSHRIIRCLYNLRRDRRSQPMFGASLKCIAEFARNYMTRLLRAPIILENENDWWKLLRSSSSPFLESQQPLVAGCAIHVDNVMRLWFT
jgi:hypothetical protein